MFPQVFSSALFLSQDPIQVIVLHFVVVSLVFSWLWQFLRLPLCLIMVTIINTLKNIGHIFCWLFLRWDLCDIFLVVRLGWWYILRKKTIEVRFRFHHILPRDQHESLLLMLTLITWLLVVFVRFLHGKVTLFAFPFYIALW